MTPPHLAQFLLRLERVKPRGEGYMARCPAHEDQENSLSIDLGQDGRVLLNCFAGCPVDRIVAAVGLKLRDLFLNDRQNNTGFATVAGLSRDKALPEEFLRSRGLKAREDGVVIPSRLGGGSPATRQRLRKALKAKDGWLWLFGKGKPVPYGLDRLQEARAAGFLNVVEGESDCWTLWFHGLPALGIPGADMTGKLEAEHARDIPKLYVIREPGQGGATFVGGIARRLGEFGWSGEAFVVSFSNVKDPNELHKSDSATFKAAFQEMLKGSSPLEIPHPEAPLDRAVDDCLKRLDCDAEAASVELILREFSSLLKRADPLQQALLRDLAVKRLGGLGFKSPARIVDAALFRQNDDDEKPHLLLSDPEPSKEPVEGAELLAELSELFSRFLVLVDGAAIALALWILHAYTLRATYVSPILAVISPEKRCGKTTLLSLLRALTPKPLPASNITPAALFRTVDEHTPTLLIDEADSFLASNDELRGILNSGHMRSTAVVIRTVGDSHESKLFTTWCAKAIALIGRLPGTLEDRSIVIPMRRRAPGETVERLRQERIDGEVACLRSRAARWAQDSADQLRTAEPAVPSELHDRAQDNWRPLLAIAEAVGGDWPEQARRAALLLNGQVDETDHSAGVRLLADLRDLFLERHADRLPSEDIVEALGEMADRPWPEWNRGKPISQTRLAKMLRPFSIRPRTIRVGSETAKGYLHTDFEDAFRRYLPAEPSHRNNVEVSTNSADSEPSQPGPCYGSENPGKAQNEGLVTAVTRRDGDLDEEGAEREVFDL